MRMLPKVQSRAEQEAQVKWLSRMLEELLHRSRLQCNNAFDLLLRDFADVFSDVFGESDSEVVIERRNCNACRDEEDARCHECERACDNCEKSAKQCHQCEFKNKTYLDTVWEQEDSLLLLAKDSKGTRWIRPVKAAVGLIDDAAVILWQKKNEASGRCEVGYDQLGRLWVHFPHSEPGPVFRSIPADTVSRFERVGEQIQADLFSEINEASKDEFKKYAEERAEAENEELYRDDEMPF